MLAALYSVLDVLLIVLDLVLQNVQGVLLVHPARDRVKKLV